MKSPAPLLSGIEIVIPFALLLGIIWLAQIVIEAATRKPVP